ncbi:MAG: HPr-rel-A system PqqD family peptide chaperone [Planctomycetaceae bacterium]
MSSDAPRLHDLRLGEGGFAFDPRTGDSYTVSATGVEIIGWLREGRDAADIAARLCTRYGIGPQAARRDVDEFLAALRGWRLL